MTLPSCWPWPAETEMDDDEDDFDDDEFDDGEFDDDEPHEVIHYQFALTLEIEDEDTITIVLSDVPRTHVPYMFSTAIADVITTTLMDMHMVALEQGTDDEEEEDD